MPNEEGVSLFDGVSSVMIIDPSPGDYVATLSRKGRGVTLIRLT